MDESVEFIPPTADLVKCRCDGGAIAGVDFEAEGLRTSQALELVDRILGPSAASRKDDNARTVAG